MQLARDSSFVQWMDLLCLGGGVGSEMKQCASCILNIFVSFWRKRDCRVFKAGLEAIVDVVFALDCAVAQGVAIAEPGWPLEVELPWEPKEMTRPLNLPETATYPISYERGNP